MRTVRALVVTVAIGILVITGSGCSPAPDTPAAGATTEPGPAPVAYDSPQAIAIVAAMQAAMSTHDLRALIVRVTVAGKDVYTGALGESLDGVPATADMHVRIGSVAFTYIGQILAMMDEKGALSLDDKLSKYLPDIKRSDEVTLRMLANMTSGYADYVYSDEMGKANGLEPFRQFDTNELMSIGLGEPMMFEPGSNWGYSHTNYTILATVLEKITGQSMGQVMQEQIVGRLGLANTTSSLTPSIPEPALQAYSSERRPFLQIPVDVPFYEASTQWSPSWTTASGAVMTSDIRDLITTAEVVGSGSLVTPEMYQQQVGNNLAGFGHPTETCPKVCKTLNDQHSYGLGVVLVNGWITQTMNFAGQGGSIGYLPDEKVAVAVVSTYAPTAFRPDGGYKNASEAVMVEVAAAVTAHLPVAH